MEGVLPFAQAQLYQRNHLSGEHQSARTILLMVCQPSIYVSSRRAYLKDIDTIISEMSSSSNSSHSNQSKISVHLESNITATNSQYLYKVHAEAAMVDGSSLTLQ
jgi:hypothetical protein